MHTELSYGARLKMRRRECDLTQAELATLVYCAVITIRKIEADQLRPSRELAGHISRVLSEYGARQSEWVQLARRR